MGVCAARGARAMPSPAEGIDSVGGPTTRGVGAACRTARRASRLVAGAMRCRAARLWPWLQEAQDNLEDHRYVCLMALQFRCAVLGS